MAEECSLMKACGFVKKYGKVKNLACRGFIRQYCRGPKMDECRRRQYRDEHGLPPHDDTIPSGHDIIAVAIDQCWPGGQTPAALLPDSADRT